MALPRTGWKWAMVSSPPVRDELPPGYELSPVGDGDARLLLPVELPTPSQLRRERAKQKREEGKRRELEKVFARASRAEEGTASNGPGPRITAGQLRENETFMGPPNPFAIRLLGGEIDVAAEQWPRLCDLGYDPHRMIPVFQSGEAIGALARAMTASISKGSKDRATRIYRELKMRGVLRQVRPPDDGALGRLRRSHPHFGDVIDFVRRCVAAASMGHGPPRIPPILLVGEPGIGKSHFARELAHAMNVPFVWQPMDGGVTAAAFVGTDKHWNEAAPGLLFTQICQGDAANPVVVLDELDKVGRPYYQDPIGPLHTLLEPTTAVGVRDLAVDIEFNASYVTWIATANRMRSIPGPILSRFTIFEVPMPGAEQALVIAETVIDSTLSEMAIPGFTSPARMLRAKVAHLTAREIRRVTEEVVGRAATNGRFAASAQDLPSWLVEDNVSFRGRALH